MKVVFDTNVYVAEALGGACKPDHRIDAPGVVANLSQPVYRR
jgi:hypothetical protein